MIQLLEQKREGINWMKNLKGKEKESSENRKKQGKNKYSKEKLD